MRSIAFSLLMLGGHLLAFAADDENVVPRPPAAKWTEVKAEKDGSVWLKSGDKAEWELIDRMNGARLDVPPGSSVAVFNADPAKPASYRAVSTSGDGKLLRYLIVVGEGGPPPGPGPTPPPKPVDDLTKLLQAAYLADGGTTKAADLKQLIALYSQAADFAASTTVSTAGELREAVGKAAATLLPDDEVTGRRLAGIRKAISTELTSVLPADPDAPLTEAVRSAASAAFSKYAAALKGVAP